MPDEYKISWEILVTRYLDVLLRQQGRDADADDLWTALQRRDQPTTHLPTEFKA